MLTRKTLDVLQLLATLSRMTLGLLGNEQTADYAVLGFEEPLSAEARLDFQRRGLRLAGLVCLIDGRPVTELVAPIDDAFIAALVQECVRRIIEEAGSRVVFPRKPRTAVDLLAWLRAFPEFVPVGVRLG